MTRRFPLPEIEELLDLATQSPVTLAPWTGFADVEDIRILNPFGAQG
jgi:hypothetical protein